MLLARALAPAAGAARPRRAVRRPRRRGARGLPRPRLGVLRDGTAVVIATHRHEEIVPEIRQGRRARAREESRSLRGGRDAPPRSGAAPADADRRPARLAPRPRDRRTPVTLTPRALLPRSGSARHRARRRPRRASPISPSRSAAASASPSSARTARGSPRSSACSWRGAARPRHGPPPRPRRARERARAARPHRARLARAPGAAPLRRAREDVVVSGFAGTIGLAEAPSVAERARGRRRSSSGSASRTSRGAASSRSRTASSASSSSRARSRPAPWSLLLDEPLAGLDAASRAWTLEVDRRRRAAGTPR